MVAIRVKSLDGIRIILALLVVIGHFYTLIGGVNLYKFNPIIQAILWSPIKAVFGFMIITGFLMMHNYLIREVKEPATSKFTFYKFWLRRFFRLYPLYILLVTIAFFSFTHIAKLGEKNLIFFTGTNATPWGFVRSVAQPTVMDYVSHVFMFHGLVPKFHDSILGVTWSLSLEMQFYFIFPFLFLFISKNQVLLKTRLLVLLLACSYIVVKIPAVLSVVLKALHSPGFREPSFILLAMPLFLLGMVMACVKHKKLDVNYLIISLFLVMTNEVMFTNFIVVVLTIFLFFDELEPFIPKPIFKILSVINAGLSGKLAEFGANISYSLYLIHTLIIAVVLDLFISNNQMFNFSKNQIVVVSFITTMTICLVLCNLLYKFIELPFITVGRNVINNMTKRIGEKSDAKVENTQSSAIDA